MELETPLWTIVRILTPSVIQLLTIRLPVFHCAFVRRVSTILQAATVVVACAYPVRMCGLLFFIPMASQTK